MCSRSQSKEVEAEALLRDSIRFGPHFADAYSSLASLYAEQVKRTDQYVTVPGAFSPLMPLHSTSKYV